MTAGGDTIQTKFQWRKEGLILIVLIVGTISLYGRLMSYNFIDYDDPRYVRDNSHLVGGLTARSIIWAFTTTAQSNWHPLTWLSYLLDVSIFGIRPGLMHTENAIIHTISVALLFILLLQMTGKPWPSAWVTAMFAWHPLHVESVAWIAERKDVLSTMFLILSLLAYVRYVKHLNWGSYGWVLTFLVLGLMAKPMLVTAPGIMLLLDFWPLKRWGDRSFTRLLIEKLPIFAIVLASIGFTIYAQSSGNSVAGLQSIPIHLRLANAVAAYGTYLGKTIWPTNLAIFYPHPALLPGAIIPAGPVFLSGIVILLITLVAIVKARQMPWLMIGWLWFLGTLVPVIGLMQVGNQALADRYTYIPLIGIFIAVAWSAHFLLPRWSGYLGLATLLATAIVSARQISFWRDTETLMTHAVAVVPDNYIAHGCLGQFYEERGDIAAAQSEFEQALRIQPNDLVALDGMALAAARQGKIDEATAFIERSIAIYPRAANEFNTYASLLERQNRIDEAVHALQTATSLEPGFAEAHYNLGMLLARKGNLAAAITEWKITSNLKPDYVDALFNLGRALIETGQSREGVARLRQAVQLSPQRADMLQLLAWSLATDGDPAVRNGPEAVEIATRAWQLSGDPYALNVFAAGLATAGQFDRAIETAKHAVELAEQRGNADLAKTARENLQLYERHQPLGLKP